MKRIIMLSILIVFGNIFLIKAQKSHSCSECNGSGTVIERCSNCYNGAIRCSSCNSGKNESTCNACYGRGTYTKEVKKKCYNCNRGYVKMEQQNRCSCRGGKRPVSTASGVTYVDCNRCGGNGYTISYYNAACSVCGGSGYSGTETNTERCNSCSGKGSIISTCTKCGGNGAYPCSICKGYANVTKTCSRCKGWGKLYTE